MTPSSVITHRTRSPTACRSTVDVAVGQIWGFLPFGERILQRCMGGVVMSEELVDEELRSL